MSEIHAPGSIPGPQGPSGAAGSLANVKSLTDNVLPYAGNRFDYTRVLHSSVVNSDGSISAGGWDVSSLIYCAGCTSAITTLPIRSGDRNGIYFCTYDANGNFIESLPSTYFGSSWGAESADIISNATAFPLPGTQTYVRFGWSQGNQGGSFPLSNAASFYATSSGTATLPGTYQPFGFDTVASVNAKDAIVATTAQNNLVASLTSVPKAALYANLPGIPGNRNLFDVTNFIANKSVNSSGALVSDSGWNCYTIYCPNATSAIANMAIRVDGGSYRCVIAYDAQMNFIADLTASWAAAPTPATNYVGPNTALSLPGTQTYVRFAFSPGIHPDAAGWAAASTSVFYAGNATNPAPTSLTATNYTPFLGTGNFTPNRKTATQLGVAPNNAAQDHTDVFNTFLATASATNPVELILDSGMYYTTGLVISPNGYTTISGCGPGTGLVVYNGTPQDGIRIGAYTASTGQSEGAYNITPPVRAAMNIVLRNFTLDSSLNVNASANQPVTGAVAHGVYGLVIANARNVLVENVNFTQAGGAFILMATNTGFLRVHGCTFGSTGTLHDGVHINGVCNDIWIDDCYFATGDDAIALNAPEGYGGDISRVTVTNCIFNGSLTVMRIYTSVTTATIPSNNVHKVRGVVVSNCSGTVRAACFNLGITDGASPTTDYDQLVDLSVSNCSFTAFQGIAWLLTPVGSVNFRNIVYVPTGTAPFLQASPSSGGRVELNGIVIRRSSDHSSVPDGIVWVPYSASVNRLVLRNISVVDTIGTSYGALAYVAKVEGTASYIEFDGIDMAHITALFDATSGTTNVTTISGAGVLRTGAAIPDAVMDNNTLYLSSTASGAPSIKVGGTVKRLTLA